MPYASNDELPPSVRLHLPPDAQDMYRVVFNHAWTEYASRAKRRRGGSREEVAHRVAWAAVKRKYVKAGDRWLARPQEARSAVRFGGTKSAP